jgi:hypothetical protein
LFFSGHRFVLDWSHAGGEKLAEEFEFHSLLHQPLEFLIGHGGEKLNAASEFWATCLLAMSLFDHIGCTVFAVTGRSSIAALFALHFPKSSEEFFFGRIEHGDFPLQFDYDFFTFAGTNGACPVEVLEFFKSELFQTFRISGEIFPIRRSVRLTSPQEDNAIKLATDEISRKPALHYFGVLTTNHEDFRHSAVPCLWLSNKGSAFRRLETLLILD